MTSMDVGQRVDPRTIVRSCGSDRQQDAAGELDVLLLDLSVCVADEVRGIARPGEPVDARRRAGGEGQLAPHDSVLDIAGVADLFAALGDSDVAVRGVIAERCLY